MRGGGRRRQRGEPKERIAAAPQRRSVPVASKPVYIAAGELREDRRGSLKFCGVLMVRIRLPPAASPMRTSLIPDATATDRPAGATARRRRNRQGRVESGHPWPPARTQHLRAKSRRSLDSPQTAAVDPEPALGPTDREADRHLRLLPHLPRSPVAPVPECTPIAWPAVE